MNTYRLPDTDDALLAECEVETYCSSGPGGQNVNRRETAVRLTHRPTGVAVTCQDERYQFRNKMLALEELRRRLEKLARRRKPRIATKATRGSKERKLEGKRIQSQKKTRRRKPAPGD
jgi:protein subunit release factor B